MVPANVEEERPEGLSTTQNTTDDQGLLGVGKIVFPHGRGHQLVIQYQMVLLKTGMQAALYILSRFRLCT